MAEGLTKKQYKELRKLEKMQSRNLEQKNSSVKWIAITVVCALFFVLFVAIIVAQKTKNSPQTADGKLQFANNGHTRMLNAKGSDASDSAIQSSNAVTLIEYGDIQCPICKNYHPIVNQLLAAYPGQLKLIFKNFPLTVHPNARVAAVAAEAAGRQGKYFQMEDMLYDKQDEWAPLDNPQAKFEEYAKSLGLDVTQFKKDQADPAIAQLISDEENEGIKNGVNGTPTFFIDGQPFELPGYTIDPFKKAIDAELKKMTGNNPPAALPTTAPDKLPLQ